MAGQVVWGRFERKLIEVGGARDVQRHLLVPGRRGRALRGLRRRALRQHDDLGADLHAIVEIGHVVIGETDAAARHLLADGGRVVGAVDAIFGAAEIHGARAMYLGGTEYRIHGTNDPTTIGKQVSSGCIRLTNDDVTDLYNRVQVGAKVIVLPQSAPAQTAQRAPTPSRNEQVSLNVTRSSNLY